jgi:5S rRNA maturation endonuclease (ribonuclease M5)/KaiC/GvpD/RAD55 family RecA-like ATPase
MNREQAKAEIKARYTEYLQPAKVKNTYICPLCGNGTGSTGDGMRIDPHGTGQQLKCFKCGFYGDIVDLYQQEHNCTAGDAFTALRDRFNITIDAEATRTPTEPRKVEQGINTTTAENQPETATERPDYAAYLNECYTHRNDPAAVKYLSFRGISQETATAYKLGYDPRKGLLIIPASRYYYAARHTNPDAKPKYDNPAGAKVELFNAQAIYNEESRPVFIVEGAFDALSIIEAGSQAVALNSTSNYNKVLEMVRKKATKNTLILCLDNDEAGAKATPGLETGLKELNISYITADICGGYKDPNEALTADKSAFTGAIKAAESAAKPQPAGLLTLERAISILEAVDDHYLEMPGFPQLSEMAKIKTHDTIVIAADTGAGKSSLALNFLHELQDRYPALYINLEMDEATILQRLVAIHTGIELDEIEGYKHDSYTRSKVNAAISEIVGRKDISLLADVYDLKEIERQIQAVTKDRTEPTIVFIDTGLLVTTANKSASRYERFTQISEELRRISRLNNIVMFVLLQQNRAGKQDEKKEPTNSSLKESGSWENDATKIMFLWWNDKTQSKELAITKNRSGKTGSIKLNYSPHTQTYSEVKDIAINALQRKR